MGHYIESLDALAVAEYRGTSKAWAKTFVPHAAQFPCSGAGGMGASGRGRSERRRRKSSAGAGGTSAGGASTGGASGAARMCLK